MTDKPLVEAKIDDYTHDLMGVTSVSGKKTFVFNALADETVSFEKVKKNRHYDTARTVQVHHQSKHRVTPPCEHFGRCGGCNSQHIAHHHQLELKQAYLQNQLKQSNIHPENIFEPIVAKTLGYRKKARVSMRYLEKKGLLKIGFREKFYPRFVTDSTNCQVLDPKFTKLLSALSETFCTLDEIKHIPQLELAAGDEDYAVILRHMVPLSDESVDKLRGVFTEHDIRLYLQPGKLDSIYLDTPKEVDPHLSYQLPSHDTRLRFQPSDFTQVNLDINRQMIDKVIELLDPQSDDELLDLFCGIGNFTLPIARYVKHITGLEFESTMIARAKENAKLNNRTNTDFYTADLSKPSDAPWLNRTYEKIILDPARTGAQHIVEHQIDALSPKKIIYISCNPSTFVRDAGILCNQKGYRLADVGILDMFPHTAHIETIGCFVQKGL